MKRFLSLLLTWVILLSVLSVPAVNAEEAAVPVKRIIPEHNKLTLAPGTSWALFWETEPANATNGWVTWKSSDPRIATVNEYGVIHAVKKGECAVSGVAQDGSGARASVRVTVRDHEIMITEPGDVDVEFETEEDTVKISIKDKGQETTKTTNRVFKTKDGTVITPEDMVIRPVKAGSDTIQVIYYEKKKPLKSEQHTVFVDQNAVGEAPRLTEDGEPAQILFLNIPWGSNWPATKNLMIARNLDLDPISERNDYLRSIVINGEIAFGNLTAFRGALNYSFRKNDRMFETRNSFNNGDLYFDPEIPFEKIVQTARTLYCLDKGTQDGNVRTWQRDHVTVRLEKKERYTILEVIWDGETGESAPDEAEEPEDVESPGDDL